MEALGQSRAEVLTAGGHDVTSSWGLAKWPEANRPPDGEL